MRTNPLPLARLVCAAALALWLPGAHAALALVDFETTPDTPQGPSIFLAVPGPQTIASAPATFSGGVMLGFATCFPAISFATAPNVYGTADFGNGVAKQLTIDINPAFVTIEVSFARFNGETFNQSYLVSAYNGANLVASQSLANRAPNVSSGYGLVDVTSAGSITQVIIAPIGNPTVFDFLIDSVGFNQNIGGTYVQPPPAVLPPPTPPVHGHRHGRRRGETELMHIDFGDDLNDVRGRGLNVKPPIPEPSTWAPMWPGFAGIALGVARPTRKER